MRGHTCHSNSTAHDQCAPTVINTLAVDSKTWSRRFQNNLPTMKTFTKTLRLRWPKTPFKVIKTVAIIIIIWAMVNKLYTKFTLPTTPASFWVESSKCNATIVFNPFHTDKKTGSLPTISVTLEVYQGQNCKCNVRETGVWFSLLIYEIIKISLQRISFPLTPNQHPGMIKGFSWKWTCVNPRSTTPKK